MYFFNFTLLPIIKMTNKELLFPLKIPQKVRKAGSKITSAIFTAKWIEIDSFVSTSISIDEFFRCAESDPSTQEIAKRYEVCPESNENYVL